MRHVKISFSPHHPERVGKIFEIDDETARVLVNEGRGTYVDGPDDDADDSGDADPKKATTAKPATLAAAKPATAKPAAS